MNKTITNHGCMRSINWHIEKPLLVMPKVIGEKIISGVKYYLGVGKRNTELRSSISFLNQIIDHEDE